MGMSRKQVYQLHGEARANRAKSLYCGTVREFLDFLEDFEVEGLIELGLTDPLESCIGKFLLFPDFTAIPAPRSWDAWALVVRELHRDERKNPIVIEPRDGIYGPSHLDAGNVMAPLVCACGARHDFHDGVILKCEACGYRRGAKAR